MRMTYPLVGMAIASATIAGGAAAAPRERGPVAIKLRQAGRIEVRPDANICVEIDPGRREAVADDDYVLGRIMAGAVNGIHLLMDERGVDSHTRQGAPRVDSLWGDRTLAEYCPDPARDLRIILHLTQRRHGAAYRLDVEFRQGAASLRQGLDRRRQGAFRFPPRDPDPPGVVTDYGPPPWTVEGDAERLTLELARHALWQAER